MVATPIGNLQDITLRALDTLKAVDIIAAEDTRHTAHLLSHYGIRKKLIAMHEHNEKKAAQQLLKMLQAGQSIAIVTDAGTPGISDPGSPVVSLCHEAGIKVVPIPGPSAVIAALSASGVLTSSFGFYGFLPATASQRKARLKELKFSNSALVFYEAPHRVLESIEDMLAVFGSGSSLTLARELTKTFESIHQCRLGEAISWLSEDANRLRGEFVLIVEPLIEKSAEPVSEEEARVIKLLLAELPLKQAVKLAANITGAKKNTLYEYALQHQESTSKNE